MSPHRPLCAFCSSSELRSHSSSSPAADTVVCSSLRGSALCFLLRLFFFLPAELEQGWRFTETGSSRLRGWLVSAVVPPHLDSLLLNRGSSVGIGEVTKWAGTISCFREKNKYMYKKKKKKRATIDNSAQFYSYYVGKTHIILLRLLDKEGLSIVSKLHV